MEGLLNYAYYQTGAINQYDQYGHLLHFSLFDVGASPCDQGYNAGDNPADNAPPPGNHTIGVPDASGDGTTTSITNANACVSWLGPNQPGINQDIGSPPYDPSVCPDGSTDPSLCNPAGPNAAATKARPARERPQSGGNAAGPQASQGTTGATGRTGATGSTGTDRRLAAVRRAEHRQRPARSKQHLRHILGGGGGHQLPHVGGAAAAAHDPEAGGAGRPQRRSPGERPPEPTCSRHETEPEPTTVDRGVADDGRGGHDPDRDRRGVPRLQREQRPAVRARPTASRSSSRTPRAWSRTTR